MCLDKSKAWDNISYEAKDLLSLMMRRNSKDRISSKEALDHSWFKDLEQFYNCHIDLSDLCSIELWDNYFAPNKKEI